MREIKFRGKCVETGEWLYGYYTKAHGVHYINDEINSDEVIEESVGQYTGFEDKHGKEIYEGDCLGHELNIVEFSNGCFNTNGDRPVQLQTGLEIVDNINDLKF